MLIRHCDIPNFRRIGEKNKQYYTTEFCENILGRNMLRQYTTRVIQQIIYRRYSDTIIPVCQIASVLKLNVGNEAKAIELDERMKEMTTMMKEHEGFESATRYVCKSEWAYELSFIFANPESFNSWKTSKTRDKVHAYYLESLKQCGIEESNVYGGARVHDKW